MNHILIHLYREWPYLNSLKDRLIEKQPDYDQVQQEHDRMEAELQEAVGMEFYLRYEATRNAYQAMCERAALLAGARTALRLLISLL